MFELTILVSAVLAGLLFYTAFKSSQNLSKYGAIIQLTAEVVRDEEGWYVQLSWLDRMAEREGKEDFIIMRTKGNNPLPTTLGPTYKSEHRDYDILPGQTYYYLVRGNRAYTARYSDRIKVTT